MYNEWITNNYKFLKKWSKIWAGDRADDLLSHFTLYLHKNWDSKFNNIPEGDERLAFVNQWMKNMVNWSNSDFNKLMRTNSLDEEWDVPDEAVDDFIEVQCETDREDIREWLLDLHRHYSEVETNKLVRLRQIYLKLELHEKVLYDMYFTNMMSLRQIGIKLNLPHMAIWSMLNDLKDKIKELYGLDN